MMCLTPLPKADPANSSTDQRVNSASTQPSPNRSRTPFAPGMDQRPRWSVYLLPLALTLSLMASPI